MLRENIKSETVTAMKAKDKERTATLRLIGAKIKDRDIELRTSSKEIPDDELVTDVLTKMAKQRRESIAMYEDGGRQELADKEKSELAEAATVAAIAAAKEKTGASSIKEMGMVMAELKAKHGAALDMGLASRLVKESF